MSEMGKYCKAYPLQQLRAFKSWSEKEGIARKEKQVRDGQETEITRPLEGADVVYLQENYIVTDGIFKDENIIFDQVTPEWKEYCQTTLKFEIPNYEPVTTS